MAFYLDPIRKAMSYLGPRSAGGYQGVTLTDGVYNEFTWDLSVAGNTNAIAFPTGNGVKVVGLHLSYATGAVTAVSVGGVNVFAATDAAPVAIPEGNTGVLTQVGGTGGKIIIKYINIEGDQTHWW